MAYCPDCGSKMYGGACTWCHEELYIADQYAELDMPMSVEFAELVNQKKEEASYYAEREDVKKALEQV